jgi:RNA polymerase sigma factor (sigma-70 family)
MATADQRQALVIQAQAGVSTARYALLEECRPGLVEFVNRQLPVYLRTQVAEEIVQDAYTLVVTRLDQFDWQECDTLGTWLKTFVAHSLADWRKYVRRKKRDYRRVLANPEANDPDHSGPGFLESAARDDETPSRVARRQEREDALKAAMHSELTDKERHALVLRYFEGLSVSMVAAVLECAPATVKNLCSRAKGKLRQALGRSSQFFSSW